MKKEFELTIYFNPVRVFKYNSQSPFYVDCIYSYFWKKYLNGRKYFLKNI